jgi:molybdopterin-guanine dinucleotide biosynthesis protein A
MALHPVEAMDAVVLAAGRFEAREAERAGHQVKAMVQIGERTPLEAMLAALRRTSGTGSLLVVGPRAVSQQVTGYDRWIPEGASGEENALAGLRAVTTCRALLCSSDLPFVQAAHLNDLLRRVPPDVDIAYPIFSREEFLAAFPGGRSKFAAVGGVHWTGGSVCVLTASVACKNELLIRRAFAARRSQLALASLLGAGVLLRHMLHTLRVEHVVRRVERLTGAKSLAVRGAHPALAMDCDSFADVEYARDAARKQQSLAAR